MIVRQSVYSVYKYYVRKRQSVIFHKIELFCLKITNSIIVYNLYLTKFTKSWYNDYSCDNYSFVSTTYKLNNSTEIFFSIKFFL